MYNTFWMATLQITLHCQKAITLVITKFSNIATLFNLNVTEDTTGFIDISNREFLEKLS